MICHKLSANPIAIKFLFMMLLKRICKLSLHRPMEGCYDAILWLGAGFRVLGQVERLQSVTGTRLEFRYIV